MNTEIVNAKSPVTSRFPASARIYAKIEQTLMDSVGTELLWPGIPNATRAKLHYLRGITLQYHGEFLQTSAGKKLARTVNTALNKSPQHFSATYWFTKAARSFLHAAEADALNTEQVNDSMHRHRVICAVIGHSGTFDMKRVGPFPDEMTGLAMVTCSNPRMLSFRKTRPSRRSSPLSRRSSPLSRGVSSLHQH